MPLIASAVHVVPDLYPPIIAVNLGQILERPVVFFLRRIAVHRLKERHSKLGRIRPVVERIPRSRFGCFGRTPLDVGFEVLVGGRIRNLQVARENVEDSSQVRGALNIGMAPQSVHATARASHVAEQQLHHRGGADNLRAVAMLRPADGINDRGSLLHVSVLADGGEQVSCLQELIPGDASDPFDHLRGVARVLLLQQLKDTARVLKSEVVGDIRWQRRRRSCFGLCGCCAYRTTRWPVPFPLAAFCPPRDSGVFCELVSFEPSALLASEWSAAPVLAAVAADAATPLKSPPS